MSHTADPSTIYKTLIPFITSREDPSDAIFVSSQKFFKITGEEVFRNLLAVPDEQQPRVLISMAIITMWGSDVGDRWTSAVLVQHVRNIARVCFSVTAVEKSMLVFAGLDAGAPEELAEEIARHPEMTVGNDIVLSEVSRIWREAIDKFVDNVTSGPEGFGSDIDKRPAVMINVVPMLYQEEKA